MTECELLANCGFYKKYQGTLDLACRGFIKTYCRGAQMDECVRKQYRMEHGQPPEDDMMPSGQIVPEQYRVKSVV